MARKLTRTQNFNMLTSMRGKAFKLYMDAGILSLADFNAIEKIYIKARNKMK